MSKHSFYLISNLVVDLLAAGFVLTQTEQNPDRFRFEGDPQGDHKTQVEVGIIEYLKLCNDVYNSTLLANQNFLLAFQVSARIPDESDRNAKCFFRCLLEMSGAAGLKDGQYDPKQTVLLLSPPRNHTKKAVLQMAAGCNKKQVDEEPCDGAYHYMQCILANILNMYGPPKWVFHEKVLKNFTFPDIKKILEKY